MSQESECCSDIAGCIAECTVVCEMWLYPRTPKTPHEWELYETMTREIKTVQAAAERMKLAVDCYEHARELDAALCEVADARMEQREYERECAA